MYSTRVSSWCRSVWHQADRTKVSTDRLQPENLVLQQCGGDIHWIWQSDLVITRWPQCQVRLLISPSLLLNFASSESHLPPKLFGHLLDIPWAWRAPQPRWVSWLQRGWMSSASLDMCIFRWEICQNWMHGNLNDETFSGLSWCCVSSEGSQQSVQDWRRNNSPALLARPGDEDQQIQSQQRTEQWDSVPALHLQVGVSNQQSLIYN